MDATDVPDTYTVSERQSDGLRVLSVKLFVFRTHSKISELTFRTSEDTYVYTKVSRPWYWTCNSTGGVINCGMYGVCKRPDLWLGQVPCRTVRIDLNSWDRPNNSWTDTLTDGTHKHWTNVWGIRVDPPPFPTSRMILTMIDTIYEIHDIMYIKSIRMLHKKKIKWPLL